MSLEFNQYMVPLAVDGDRQTKVTTAPVLRLEFVLDLNALNWEPFAERCAKVTEQLIGGVAFLMHGAPSVEDVLYSV